ncbi:MAG: hypothetical protein DRP02_02380 [Candidatus Gerdarchaeota archaeon]|nr:MAG: hypothetical protein DRP02_02380 [Candidatus Gerdarchaeota archaeon]
MATNDFSAVYAQVFGKLEAHVKRMTVFEKLRGKIAHNALAKGGMGKTYNYDNTPEGKARANTRGTDNVIQNFTNTQTQLVINRDFEYSFTQNQFDQKLYQNAGDFLLRHYKTARKELTALMDGDFLGEVSKSSITIDQGDLGGTAGVAIEIGSTYTAKATLAKAKAKVANSSGEYADMSMVATPDVLADFETEGATSGFNYADAVMKNGFLGMHMLGVNFYVSNQVRHALPLTWAGQPTDGDTFIVKGQTLTAVAAIGTTAGNFLIGASADATKDNMNGLINNPATTSATQRALGTATSDEVANFVQLSAVDTSATVNTLVSKFGKIAYTNALTNVTVGVQQAECYIGPKGMIELANPIPVHSIVRKESQRSDENYLTEAAWGVQVPTENRKKFGKLVIKTV